MANILTATQAANALRVSATDPRLLDLLPQVDKLIERATGRDWTQDASVHPLAASAATIALVRAFEDPGALAEGGALPWSFASLCLQLQAEALKYQKWTVDGAATAGGIYIPNAPKGAAVIKIIGVAGVSGSQVSKFETVLTEDNYIQQTAAEDLSANQYVIVVKHPSEDVSV